MPKNFLMFFFLAVVSTSLLGPVGPVLVLIGAGIHGAWKAIGPFVLRELKMRKLKKQMSQTSYEVFQGNVTPLSKAREMRDLERQLNLLRAKNQQHLRRLS